jgi:hypothetical protein
MCWLVDHRLRTPALAAPGSLLRHEHHGVRNFRRNHPTLARPHRPRDRGCGDVHRPAARLGDRAGRRDVSITLYGSHSTLHWRGGDNLSLGRIGAQPEAITPDEGTAVGWNVETDFVASIRGQRPVELTNFEAGLHYMRITETVHRSLYEGRVVNVDEV